MTVDDKTIWRINSNSMNGNLIENAGGTGLMFGAAGDAVVNTQALRLSTTDGIEALFGYRNGVTYIRFRNGDNPGAKNIRHPLVLGLNIPLP
jgi:hypothetical protein